jgi:hypothetical protein
LNYKFRQIPIKISIGLDKCVGGGGNLKNKVDIAIHLGKNK